jgi:hypothetical protein
MGAVFVLALHILCFVSSAVADCTTKKLQKQHAPFDVWGVIGTTTSPRLARVEYKPKKVSASQ